MKNKVILIISIICIVSLMSFLFLITRNSNKVLLIEAKDIYSTIRDEDFIFLYNGNLNDDIKSFIKDIKNNNRVVTYQINLKDDEMSAISSDKVTIEKDGYLVYVNGELVGFISNSLNDSEKMEQVKKYLYGYIPENERYYQVLSTANEYIKKYNSKDYTVAVFGSNDCNYCTRYLPVINEVARKNNLNIYYFERGTYDKQEYEKILEIDFTIPGECTQSGDETSLSRAFDKPLTVITRNGKLVGCIKGYVTESVLTDKLKEFKLVKE